MRAILFVIFVLSAAGCSHYTPAEITSISQSYINSWQSPESMTVSEENQIAFLRSYLAETKKPLGEALEHPSYSVRMWAAYVIGQIGPVARMMESQLTERLQSEQNRVVRIYLYEAVQKTELGTPALIALLRQRFEALDDSPSGQDYSNRRWNISDADEKIHLAATFACWRRNLVCCGDRGTLVGLAVRTSSCSRRGVFSFFMFVFSALGPIDQGEFVRPVCRDNLRNIGFSLLAYEDHNRTLPPVCTTDRDGRMLHSWRTLLLPFIEEFTNFSRCRLKEPWNSPHNRFLGQINIDLFHCPKDPGFKVGDTSYVAVVGPGTAWRVGQGVSLQAIKDGLYDTILLVEMKSSGIHWAEPKDLDLENLPPGITTDNLVRSLSPHEHGFFAVFVDNHVEFIPNTITWDDFHAMLSIAGGEKVNRTW